MNDKWQMALIELGDYCCSNCSRSSRSGNWDLKWMFVEYKVFIYLFFLNALASTVVDCDGGRFAQLILLGQVAA
jgi:hypothetical protein